MLRCVLLGVLACLLLSAPSFAATTNPDGTVNCGTRYGYGLEVGHRNQCPLGWRVHRKVRRHYKAHGIVDGDRFKRRVEVPDSGGRYVYFTCFVSAGKYGSQALCSVKGTGIYASISRYV